LRVPREIRLAWPRRAGLVQKGAQHVTRTLAVARKLQGAIEDNWKILSNQQASVYLARLEPGGIREPHWHPSAWELNYVISSKVRWRFVGPEATHDTIEAESGDLVFAPQGHFHYFENPSSRRPARPASPVDRSSSGLK
jgi:oxalate decarboxylase/phosphoglucose isomerase-like protein (cupin superfamily)